MRASTLAHAREWKKFFMRVLLFTSVSVRECAFLFQLESSEHVRASVCVFVYACMCVRVRLCACIACTGVLVSAYVSNIRNSYNQSTCMCMCKYLHLCMCVFVCACVHECVCMSAYLNMCGVNDGDYLDNSKVRVEVQNPVYFKTRQDVIFLSLSPTPSPLLLDAHQYTHSPYDSALDRMEVS